MITDLTTGSPYKKLIKLSLPMVLSIVFQQLYNIVDSIIVGRFVGTDALAAVGASYSITMIFMAVATGSSIGITVVVSRCFGGKRYGDLKCSVWTSVFALAALAVVFTVAGAALSRPMMQILNTPQQYIGDAVAYLQIYFYGLITVYLYNVCTGVFNGLGDANTTLYFLIFSSVLNVALDIIFVKTLSLGVAGAAWATLIAQSLAAVLSFIVMLRRLKRLKSEPYRLFSFKKLATVAKIAVPSILQHSFVSVGNVFVQKRVNDFGPDVAAAYTAAIKLNTFAVSCYTSMSNAMSTFTAQNLAAGRLERVKKSFLTGNIILWAVCLPFMVAFLFFGREMVGLFADETISANYSEVVGIGADFLRIVSPFYLIIGVKLIADGINRGAERMVAFMTSTFADLALRVVFAFVLSLPVLALNERGIWLSWPIGWVVSTIISIIFYAAGGWKKAAATAEEKQ